MIVSTTLAHNCEKTIGQALKSVVEVVDRCLLFPNGVTDRTVEVAQEVCGDKLTVIPYEWTGRFDDARNFCLDEAAKTGAEYALIVDADEEIHFKPGYDLKKHILGSKIEMFLAFRCDRTYSKGRLILLPSKYRWKGPTHEGLDGAPESCFLENVCFTEHEKTPEQLQAKYSRDLAILEEYVKDHPEARWRYFMGSSLHGLGRELEAITQYMECTRRSDQPQEAAWAQYCCAQCAMIQKDYQAVIGFVVTGLALCPGMAELPWMASVACLKLNRYQDAIDWANMAIANGGTRRDPRRVWYQELQGLYEGPFQVLYFANTALERHEEAKKAEATWTAVRAKRLGLTP